MARLVNWRVREDDLRKATDEELATLKTWIETEESRRKYWNSLEVAVDCVNTGDEYFRAAGLAMLHLLRLEAQAHKPHQWHEIVKRTEIQLPEDFSARDHAYHLAQMAHKYYDRNTGAAGDRDAADRYMEIGAHFSEADFVFGLTKYDECTNGYYFRRS